MSLAKRRRRRIVVVLALGAATCYGYAVVQSERELRAELASAPEPATVSLHSALAAGGEAAEASAELRTASTRIAAFQAFFSRMGRSGAMDTVVRFHSRLREEPYPTLTPSEKDEIRAAIGVLQPELAELRELVRGGGPVAVLDFLQQLDTDEKHLEHLKACAALLRLDLIVQIEAGNSATAREDVVAGLELAAILAREPYLFAHLERWRMIQALRDTLQRDCALDHFATEDLEAIIIVLAGAKHREEFVAMLQSERLRGIYGFDRMVKAGWRERVALADQMFQGNRDVFWAGTYLYLSPLCRIRHNREMVSHGRLLGLAADAALLPYYEAKAQWDKIESGYDDATLGMLCFSYGPRIRLIDEQQAGCEADLDLMRLGLGLALYHRERGVYPESLVELSHLLGGALPRDPYSGEHYRYKRDSDGGIAAYSVNWNLRDDGGNEEDHLDTVWCAG